MTNLSQACCNPKYKHSASLPVSAVVLLHHTCYNSGVPSAPPRPDIMTTIYLRLFYIALPLLAACASVHVSDAPVSGTAAAEQATADVAQPAETPEEVPEPIEYGNFSRDQLELALLSEFSGLRGNMTRAAEGYYRLALETLDAGILRRAVEYASALGNAQALGELANQWLQLDPDAMDPHLIMGYQYLEQGQFVRSLPHMEKVLELGGQVDFTALSARTFPLEDRQRKVIIEQLVSIQSRYPDEPSIYYALAQIHDQSGESDLASAALDDARQRFGENPRTVMIMAQLLQNMDQTDAAEQTLADGVVTYPGHRLLRQSYAQILVQNNKLSEAATQFSALLQREPQDMESLYSLALINLELEQLTEAETRLRELLRSGHRRNETHFYLAYLLETRGERDEALYHYQQISRQSNTFLNAQREIARLLIELERFDEASDWSARMSADDNRLAPVYPALEAQALLNAGYTDRARQVLDRALDDFPENTDLLFARTVLNEQQNRHDAAESDLRRIISINPDDARALNHLGYSLTTRTDRHEEALELIERAIAISPDDPAIIDSLGWVQFNLGYLEDALYNLQRAYAAFPDPEVAAHLGEVLWVMGREAEALLIWEEALETNPESEHVLDAMQRLTRTRT